MIRRLRERRRQRRAGQLPPYEVKVGNTEIVVGGWWAAQAVRLWLRVAAFLRGRRVKASRMVRP